MTCYGLGFGEKATKVFAANKPFNEAGPASDTILNLYQRAMAGAEKALDAHFVGKGFVRQSTSPAQATLAVELRSDASCQTSNVINKLSPLLKEAGFKSPGDGRGLILRETKKPAGRLRPGGLDLGCGDRI